MAGNKIQLKRTSVPGRLPSNTDIDVGELAINLVDNRLFTKNGSNTIVDVHGQSLNTTSSVQFANVVANNISATTLAGNLAWSYVTSVPYANSTANGVVLIVDSVSNTSATVAASANAVKTAYDTAILAYSNAIAYSSSINIPDGITQLAVTNSGASGYLLDQYTGGNPTIYVGGGETISFSLAVPGHPFLIRVSSGGANTTDGLTHVSNTGVITTGSSAQGQVAGTLFWKVPFSLVGSTYVYQCSVHGGMVGNIVITPPSSYFANASNITSGTLDTARLPATANISTAVNVGANVNLTTSGISVGNTSANVQITGGGINTNGPVAVTNTLASGNTTITGFANVSSTLAVTGVATFSNNVIVSGNLVVTGSTTYVNTNIFQVSDNIITLNADATGAPADNVGFEVNRGSSAYTYLLWDEGIDKWTFTNDGTTYFNIASNTDVNTAYSNAVANAASDATTKAATAYSNAVAYAASNTYVNSTFAPLAGATFTGPVSGITTLAAGNTTITGFANVSSTLQVGANVILGTTTISANGGVGTAGQVLTSGAGGNVYWSTVAAGGFANGQSISVANLVVTNIATLNAVSANGGLGTAGQVLTTNGSNVYWSTVSGGGSSNTFGTISIAGQTDVVADTTTDALTFVAGSGMTITTDASTDTITFASSGSATNTFGTIAIAGQTSVVADTTTDTLTFVAGNNVTITTDVSTDTITFVANNTLFTLSTSSNNSSANISLTGTGLTANTVKVIGAGGVNVNSNGSVITIDGTGVAGGGGGGNSFGTVTVSGQSDVIADQANDVLTLVAGSGMTITTSPGGDTITFTSSGGGGSGSGTGTAFIAARDNFTANGTQTVFTLTTNATANSILVAVDGLIQFHTEDYSVSGTTLTFVTAPANNEVLEVLHISGATNYLFQQYAAIDSFSGNGSNTGFTLTRSANTNTAQVYLDGLLQDPNNDYTFTGTALTFTTAPLSAEAILVYHTESSSGNPHLTSISGIDTFAGDGTTTVFTLTGSANTSTSFITVNGLVQRYTTDYTLSGTTLTFVDAPPNGSAVQGWRLTGSLGVTYKTIQVSGQSDIVADQADDILTFANGAGITITTNAGTDTLTIAQSAITKQSLAGNGSNTIFTLSTSTTEDDILVFVDGTYFHPTDDYTVSGTTITFASAPINSAEIRIRYMR